MSKKLFLFLFMVLAFGQLTTSVFAQENVEIDAGASIVPPEDFDSLMGDNDAPCAGGRGYRDSFRLTSPVGGQYSQQPDEGCEDDAPPAIGMLLVYKPLEVWHHQALEWASPRIFPEGGVVAVNAPNGEGEGQCQYDLVNAPPEGEALPGEEEPWAPPAILEDTREEPLGFLKVGSWWGPCPAPEPPRTEIAGEATCEGFETWYDGTREDGTHEFSPAQAGTWTETRQQETVVLTSTFPEGEASDSITLAKPEGEVCSPPPEEFLVFLPIGFNEAQHACRETTRQELPWSEWQFNPATGLEERTREVILWDAERHGHSCGQEEEKETREVWIVIDMWDDPHTSSCMLPDGATPVVFPSPDVSMTEDLGLPQGTHSVLTMRNGKDLRLTLDSDLNVREVDFGGTLVSVGDTYVAEGIQIFHYSSTRVQIWFNPAGAHGHLIQFYLNHPGARTLGPCRPPANPNP